MRPILVANIHSLRGQKFLIQALYNDKYVIAQKIAILKDESITRELRNTVWANDDNLPAFDVWTSTEEIYLQCLTEADISAHYKTTKDTKETLRMFQDKQVQEALIDLYKLKDPNEVSDTETQKPLKWYEKLINLLKV